MIETLAYNRGVNRVPVYKMEGSKNGKQKYRVRVNYVDSFGKSRQLDRVAYGSSEAKELERQLTYEFKNISPVARMTVGQLFCEYEKASMYELRETSRKKNIDILSKHVLPFFNDVPLDKLTVSKIQKWKNYVEEKGLKLRTRQNVYSCFRTLLNWGVKLEYLQTNILLKIGNFKASDEIKKEMLYYTDEEYKLFSKAARKCAESSGVVSDWDYFVFFSIAFYTGLRKGEIHALRWSDINGEYLKVSRSVTQKLSGDDRETMPKNKSSVRTLQLPKPLINILSEHKERYKSAAGFSESFRICGGRRCLRDTSVENMNKKFAQIAGVKKIRIHDFRHSHVSLLANAGINIQEIARRLGHSDVKVTWNTYSHLYPKEEERAVEVLNKIV